jgi:DNA invertase Pin-like site-specific DNA recombinase
MKTALVYTRVSGRSQQDGSSPDEQVAQCTTYAGAHGYTIVGEYRDVVSGDKAWQDRPAARALVERLAAGGVACVLVHMLDRVARGKSAIFDDFLQACADAGSQVVSVVDGLLTEDDTLDEFANADKSLILSIKQAVIRAEKRKLVQRMRLGKAAKRELGKHVDGIYRYGRDPRRPAESAILERIRAQAQAGVSGRSIAKALNSEGIPARSASAWSSQAVSGILRREQRESLLAAIGEATAVPAESL